MDYKAYLLHHQDRKLTYIQVIPIEGDLRKLVI